MTRFILLIAASAISTSAFAQAAPSWQADLTAELASEDPAAGWKIAPIGPTPLAAKTKACILIESFRDGTTETSYHGDVTLKRGWPAMISADETQALLLPQSVEVCDWELGCTTYDLAPSCIAPLCGGVDVLAAESTLYLAVDLAYDADGTQTATVTDLIDGISNGIVKIEPEEID